MTITEKSNFASGSVTCYRPISTRLDPLPAFTQIAGSTESRRGIIFQTGSAHIMHVSVRRVINVHMNDVHANGEVKASDANDVGFIDAI